MDIGSFMNNINDAYTFDEYKDFLIRNGINDEFEFEWKYKLYLSVHSGDEKKIEKAKNNYYYNALFRLTYRYN